jgi:hypothetical protein
MNQKRYTDEQIAFAQRLSPRYTTRVADILKVRTY